MNTTPSPDPIAEPAAPVGDDRPAVLVLGAGGRLGAACVRAFAEAGWRVVAQARRPLADLPPSASLLTLDLADTGALVAAAAGVRAVVYAVSPAYTDWDASMMPLARQGMDVAERLDARFMLPGNVYGFGTAMPPVLSEDTPMHPDTVKGAQRLALEDEMAARPRLRSLVIRAGDFYGAGTGSWMDLAIVKDIGRGRLVYPGPLDVVHAWAYLPDLARAFVAAAAREAALPRATRLHFAGHALTGAQLLDAIERAAARLGAVPAAGWGRAGVPWGLLRVLGLVRPMMRELAQMSYLWRVPHRLDDTRLEAALGPLPSTPVDVAMVQTLRALGVGERAAGPVRLAEQGGR